jgi:hypothetical protein
MSKNQNPRSLQDEIAAGGPGVDPYSTATATAADAASAPGKPRRTLDDMRRLSEEIKKNRQKK